MPRWLVQALVLVATAGLAAGCGSATTRSSVGTQEDAGRTPVGGPSVPPTSAFVQPGTSGPPTPTSTAPTGVSPAWRMSHDGFGPIRLGMTLAEASAVSGETLEIVDAEPGSCNPTTSDLAMLRGKHQEEGEQIFFGVRDEVIVNISTKDPAFQTTTGITGRSSIADVQRAYPSAFFDTTIWRQYWRVIDDRGHELIFGNWSPVGGLMLIRSIDDFHVGGC